MLRGVALHILRSTAALVRCKPWERRTKRKKEGKGKEREDRKRRKRDKITSNAREIKQSDRKREN